MGHTQGERDLCQGCWEVLVLAPVYAHVSATTCRWLCTLVYEAHQLRALVTKARHLPRYLLPVEYSCLNIMRFLTQKRRRLV
jgi:hypothetical protein